MKLHDRGGTGSPVLLIPGLCGYAGEWADTAARLTPTHRVYAVDPRGHGDAERRPADVSREAHVADVAAVLAEIGPAVLVGQSLGGHTAMLTAAWHPDLVTRLVLVEAGPAGDDDDTAAGIDRWLGSWPVPFPDLEIAAEFFGGGAAGAAWAGGLRRAEGGWEPAFDRDIMVATIAAAAGPRWDDFARIACATPSRSAMFDGPRSAPGKMLCTTDIPTPEMTYGTGAEAPMARIVVAFRCRFRWIRFRSR